MKKKDSKYFWLALLVLLAVGLFAAKALFRPGFYTSHDGEHQLVRLHQFHKLLTEGQIPPRWAGDLRNGYGYPLFIFSYRLPWYFGELFLRLGFSLVNSVKALFILATLLSAVFMFLWQKELWGIAGGLLAALLYIWAPYRFSVNLVRAALGEAWVIAAAPLLFYSLHQLAKRHRKGFIYLGALAFSAMLLAHVITAMLYLPIAVGYALILWVETKRSERPVLIKNMLLLLVFGLGLSAFYWLPAMYEQRFIPALSPEFFSDHLLVLKQLIYSPWGYTFSMPGVDQDGMSFQVGIAQWLTLALVLAGSLCFRLVSRNKRKKFKPDKMLLAGYYLVVFALSIFFMLEPVKAIWKFLSRIIVIDFPWRLISVSVLSASVLAGFCLAWLKKIQPWLAAAFFAALLAVAGYTNRNHLNVNQYTFFPESFYTDNRGTSNSYDEYTPLWGNGDYLKVKREILEFIVQPEPALSQGEILGFDHHSSAEIIVDFRVDSEQALMRLNSLYYPGWQLFLDGQPIEFDYQTSNGIMNFVSPKGEHQLKAVFKETPLRRAADWISGLSFIILVIAFARPWIGKRRMKNG